MDLDALTARAPRLLELAPAARGFILGRGEPDRDEAVRQLAAAMGVPAPPGSPAASQIMIALLDLRDLARELDPDGNRTRRWFRERMADVGSASHMFASSGDRQRLLATLLAMK